MPSGVRLSLLALVPVLAGCNDAFELPPEVAASEYVVYHTDADASAICLEDLLARQDRFIERTAMRLGVEPPPEPVHFVWDLVQDGSEPWACNDNVNCYKHRTEEKLSVVVSQSPINHHELVHAVDAQTLGTQVHRTLEEGLAEYLGSLQTTRFAPGVFPAAFKAMLAESPIPSDYGLAMHFVGSVFARHGVERFLELREAMPEDARPEEFAGVFASVYGQSLDDALDEMSGEQVYAIDDFAGCDDAPELAWSADGLLDAELTGACGDRWFFGPGFVEGRMGFLGFYVIEVAEAGDYELTVGPAADGLQPFRGVLTACSFDLLGSQALSLAGRTGRGTLQPGRHTLGIAFPPQSEARGRARVRLEYVGPPSGA